MRRAVAPLAFSSVVVAAACMSTSAPTSPDSSGSDAAGQPGASADRVARVTVSPDTLTLQAGSNTVVTYTAALLDSAGHALSAVGVHWSSSDSALAQPAQGDTTSTLYVVQGRDTGTVTITAASQGKQGTASLHIVPSPAAVDLTGTWISDTIQPPTYAPCQYGYCLVKLVIRQSGDSVTAQEFVGYTGAGPATFDSAGPAAGPISAPCLVNDCAAKLTYVPTNDPNYGNGGTYWLTVQGRDTLRNVTPDSANHSYMPTRFVRQPDDAPAGRWLHRRP